MNTCIQASNEKKVSKNERRRKKSGTENKRWARQMKSNKRQRYGAKGKKQPAWWQCILDCLCGEQIHTYTNSFEFVHGLRVLYEREMMISCEPNSDTIFLCNTNVREIHFWHEIRTKHTNVRPKNNEYIFHDLWPETNEWENYVCAQFQIIYGKIARTRNTALTTSHVCRIDKFVPIKNYVIFASLLCNRHMCHTHGWFVMASKETHIRIHC